MKKRTYIQPKMNVAVMPQYALMAMNPSPTDGSQDPAAGAAKRRTKVF